MSQIAIFVLSNTVGSVGLAYVERYVVNNLLSSTTSVVLSSLLKPVFTLGTFTVTRAVGLVGLVNITGTAILMFYLGMKVGKAREPAGVKYPAMYATGDDEKAMKFNCTQRGHQNALESYPQILAMSVVGGLRHPFVTTAAGLLWIVSRHQFMEGYATGDPDKRYNFWGFQHWRALFGLMVFSSSACLGILNVV